MDSLQQHGVVVDHQTVSNEIAASVISVDSVEMMWNDLRD
jgi:hypothetical protein